MEQIIKQYLSDKHAVPSSQVVSALENYPPTETNALLAKVVTALQVVTVVGALGIENFVPLPEHIKEKKMMIVMLAIFVGNTVRNSLMSTGAFEVWYDDKMVWSKLATGRMPTGVADVVSGMESVLGAAGELKAE